METSCEREAMGIMPQSITLDHLLTDSDILLSHFLAFSSTTINKTFFLNLEMIVLFFQNCFELF